MIVFATGTCGFIGSHIVDNLIDRGYSVGALARGCSDTQFLSTKAKPYKFDTFNPDEVASELTDIDYFIHIAGLTKSVRSKDYYTINSELVNIWLKACHKYCKKLKKFVLISSIAALGPSDKPLTENTTPNPTTEYGKSKLLGEKYAEKFMDRMPITIIRPPAVYGPRDKDFLSYFKLASRGFLPIAGNPKCQVSFIHAFDLANGIILAMESDKSTCETFLISDGTIQTRESFAQKLSENFDRKSFTFRIPISILRSIAASNELISKITHKAPLLSFAKARDLINPWPVDSSKITNILGFKPRYNLDTGLADTARWYRSIGWLK